MHPPTPTRWPCLLALALSGCGAPISNQPFLDEALFLAALPSQARLGAPSSVLLAPNGASALLQQAKENAALWDAWWAIAVATGEELRTIPADERTDAVRRWDPVNVAARLNGEPFGLPSGEVYDWWVQVEIAKLVDGDITWTLAVAPTEDGDFVEVGVGTDRGGSGELTWDLPGLAGALGLTPATATGAVELGALETEYTDQDEEYDGARTAWAEVQGELGAVAGFGLVGEDVLLFTDTLAITDDGAGWPAFVTAAHTEIGGRAEGIVGAATGDLVFSACWGPDGAVLWQGGDPGITSLGAEAACPIGPF